MIGPFYKGQVPFGALTITLKTSEGLPVNLDQYSSIEVRITDPLDKALNLTGSSVLPTGAAGEFKFFWPGPATVLNSVGDYSMQVALHKDGAYDLTNIGGFEVHRQLGTVN